MQITVKLKEIFKKRHLTGEFDYAGSIAATNVVKFVSPPVCATAINENAEQENHISIYPNPFTSTITIQNQNFNQVKFTIHNIFGQSVFNEQENNLSSNYTKTIDLSFLSQGIYLIDIIIDGERTVKKIVKE